MLKNLYLFNPVSLRRLFALLILAIISFNTNYCYYSYLQIPTAKIQSIDSDDRLNRFTGSFKSMDRVLLNALPFIRSDLTDYHFLLSPKNQYPR